jgi:hypothetical protein
MGILLIVWFRISKNVRQCKDSFISNLKTNTSNIRHACTPRAAPLGLALAILALFQLTAPFRWLSKADLVVKAVACLFGDERKTFYLEENFYHLIEIDCIYVEHPWEITKTFIYKNKQKVALPHPRWLTFTLKKVLLTIFKKRYWINKNS